MSGPEAKDPSDEPAPDRGPGPRPPHSRRAADPLHGITLQAMLELLVEKYGWAGLAEKVPVRCFSQDPSLKSSLTFLRRTPWAREKVEQVYLRAFHSKPRKPSPKRDAAGASEAGRADPKAGRKPPAGDAGRGKRREAGAAAPSKPTPKPRGSAGWQPGRKRGKT